MAAKNTLSPTPLLSEKHNGIPARLFAKAQQAKSAIFNIATKSPSNRNQVAIPQGVGENAFHKAIKELGAELGKEHVEFVTKLVDGWYMENPNTHDAMHVSQEDDFVASAIVYPGTTEEVQTIVRWANKHRIPISPISIGRNYGYGGAAPRVRGAVVIDLGRRMNRILDINSDDCTCLVEPGVTYFALYEEIQARGLKNLWVDVPDIGGGSVLGNAMDRGVGYTPYGDHWMMHSGMEVVLPTGEVIRTGMGALPGNNSWQLFPYGFGPTADGIFSQSNMGIVTKMGFGLMPNPGGYESYLYTFSKEEDLAQLIEIIRPLRIAMILENVAQLRHISMQVALEGKPRSAYYNGKGRVPDKIIHDAAKAHAQGDCAWLYYGMAYGPQDTRTYKLDIIHKEFMKIPGARRIDPSSLPTDDYFWVRDRVASGVPDLEELRWVNWHPNGGHVAFSPVSPVRGRDATALFEIARRRCNEFDLDIFPTFVVGLREMHLIVEIVFNRDDPVMRANARACLRGMIDDAAGMGYGEYRTHLAFMDQIAGTYDWNDGALMKFNEKIKDCLDPNGILAPGKSGIWPARYRGRGWEMSSKNELSEGRGVIPSAGSTRL
ncbi:Putative Aryl-alcohol oxidase; vanillyl-alcohol oxidase [Penicillium brasilianum]|uniref:Putative Aryl-alcohol oxidase vanillyl-alcohol oxidase n=1 Tax=Penicillium brasilianum TaxID=104259 RepID=A0A0F7TGR7_PENBI|nr:Putative Aryl-alcohol oxidase; vanillyl-alcohol oxidase [Penicillium brasilianum]